MRHLIFSPAPTYPVALLTKATSFRQHELVQHYVNPLVARGLTPAQVIAFTLAYNEAGKAPAKFIKEYLEQLLPVLANCGVEYLLVADAAYFKVLTRQPKADPHWGYVLPCAIKGYEYLKVVLTLNHTALIYNPALQDKLTMSLDTVAAALQGTYQPLGGTIIHSAVYPGTVQDIADWLESLHQYPALTCDIETFSLRFDRAGIGTIAFAWDQHNGGAFACDYADGASAPNPAVRYLLREFFQRYQGKLIFHNAGFDAKVLIYTLWMDDLLDTEGLLKGLEVMTRHLEDTKIIAYLATNSTAGNVLGLKALAHEFAGNWAQDDIKDITRIDRAELLQYNLVDALSTWYVYEKFTPIMIQDQQEELYRSLMLPSLKVILQMELTGMPMNPATIARVREQLEAQRDAHLRVLTDNPIIKVLDLIVQQRAMEAANAKLKTKQHPLEKFADRKFNPNSGPQLQHLLYKQMGLPVLDTTDTGQPATGADTLEKLIHHTSVPEYQAILKALIGYGKVTKILGTFIPAFEAGLHKPDGMQYLHGSFNLGGTVSGRLSSSDPNMQNIPAGSDYGELIKTCFEAPPGWLMVGADFNSLEDYISALTTRDPNKLRVYEEGYDGHCLRAKAYFGEQMPDIEDTVESINSIKTKYPELRQHSKGPTFALTYQGTWHTLVNNLGFDPDTAKAIEKGYHELYKVSDDYVQQRLKQASEDGYVEVAFGLRVRTPLLKQVVWNGPKMPYEAAAEGRTAGNALGQSYGLLNNRAVNAFMQDVWDSPYRLDIKPIALIHDAIYLLVRDDVEVVHFVNQRLIAAMQWQNLPELVHPTVKLGAALDIFWPTWANATTLPNGADRPTIIALCEATKEKLQESQTENQTEDLKVAA